MNETVLTKSIYLKATPEKVWAYLTDPEQLAKWFHKPTSPLLEGEYEVLKADGSRLMWGTILFAKPYQRLEYTFAIAPLGDCITTVKWNIEEFRLEQDYRWCMRDCHQGPKLLT